LPIEFLTHLSKAHMSFCHGAVSVIRPPISTFSFKLLLLQKRLQGSTPNLAQIFLMVSLQSAVTYKCIQNPIWPPWPLIGWHIFDFISRTAAGIYSKHGTNVPYGVPNKCCYFYVDLKSNMATLAWLADTFFTFSQEQLQESTPKLAQMFLMWSRLSVVAFTSIWNPRLPPLPLIGWHTRSWSSLRHFVLSFSVIYK